MVKKAPERPLPTITELNAPFWQAARQDKLVMQRCKACREFVWCPRPACVECGSDELEWEELSGRGTVYSFTIIRQATGRGAKVFEKEIPYAIAWVDLVEGPRFYTNIVECAVDAIEIGMSVQAVFDSLTEEISLPKFRPV